MRLFWLAMVVVAASGCGESGKAPTIPSTDVSTTVIRLGAQTPQDDVVFWNQRRTLTWDDYLGSPDPKSPFLAFSQVGSTPISTVTPNSDGTVTIFGGETILNRGQSWVTSEGRTAALLEHEQGHFDLEESVTREFRSAVTSAALHESGDKLRATVSKLVARFDRQSHSLHDRYDRDTVHGTDPTKQQSWNERIARLLNEPDLPPCGPGSVRWSGNNHCYEAVLAPGLSWADAQAACVTRGGHLATITSAAEESFVLSLFESNSAFWFVDSFNNALGPWIGGFQPTGAPEPAGGWVWVTGEPWSYTNWSTGEPNNCCGGQDRLRFFRQGNAGPVRWDDCESGNPVAHRRGYIFESD